MLKGGVMMKKLKSKAEMRLLAASKKTDSRMKNLMSRTVKKPKCCLGMKVR